MTNSETKPPREPKRRRRWLLAFEIFSGVAVVLFIVSRFLLTPFTMPTGSMERTLLVGDHILVNRLYSEPHRGDVIVFQFPGNRDQAEPDRFEYYLKRCVAIAGDTVQLRNKRVYVNGVAQADPATVVYTSYPTPQQDMLRTFPDGFRFTRDSWGPMRVPKKGDVIPLNDSTFYAWRTFVMREGHRLEKDETSITVDGKPASSYAVEHDYWFSLGDNRDNSLDSRYWGFVSYERIGGRPWIVLYNSDSSGRWFKNVE